MVTEGTCTVVIALTSQSRGHTPATRLPAGSYGTVCLRAAVGFRLKTAVQGYTLHVQGEQQYYRQRSVPSNGATERGKQCWRRLCYVPTLENHTASISISSVCGVDMPIIASCAYTTETV